MKDDTIIRRNIEQALSTTLPPKPVDLDRELILTQREQTHGSFAQNAAMWDNLLFAMDGAKIQKPEHRLAVSMMILKLCRAAQHPEIADHWIDIAGYAKLAAEACE